MYIPNGRLNMGYKLVKELIGGNAVVGGVML